MQLFHTSLISVVIPCYNEHTNVTSLAAALRQLAVSQTGHKFEFIYVNDGSCDATLEKLQKLATDDKRVKIVSFSRNFGKEMATTAGIHSATGDAIVTIDADGQHPVELIPEFIARWSAGAQVVVGVRSNTHKSLVKNLSSKIFYRLFNSHSDQQLVPGSTDFRLIDQAVQQEFIKLTEHSRITRGLIDWLGFRREYVYFQIDERRGDSASYGYNKLAGLALDSIVSLSLKPLYVLAYSGLAALVLSAALALFSAIEMLIGDPLGLDITGSAYLVLLVLFLVGIILISQGVLALYISHIHTETKNRPLYIIDRSASHGLKEISTQ